MSARVTSEGEVIGRYFAPLAAGLPGAFDLKDDCAAIHPPPGHDLVLTTDAVAAGVHVLPSDDPADIAWKALAVNVSDLVGKGAEPLCYLMSCAFPEAPEHAWLASFAAGLRDAQNAFGIVLAGGDTDRRPGPLAVTITAIGTLPAGRMVRRATAEPGDRIVVSGTIGDAALGLKLRLDAGWPAGAALSQSHRRALVARATRPSPRLALVPALRAHARAAMDVSDGLVKDLARMAEASGCGAVIDAARVPLSPAAVAVLAADQSLIADCLAGGEDYEVLAALPPPAVDDYCRVAELAGVSVTIIGEITQAPGVVVRGPAGAPMPLAADGYDHF